MILIIDLESISLSLCSILILGCKFLFCLKYFRDENHTHYSWRREVLHIQLCIPIYQIFQLFYHKNYAYKKGYAILIYFIIIIQKYFDSLITGDWCNIQACVRREQNFECIKSNKDMGRLDLECFRREENKWSHLIIIIDFEIHSLNQIRIKNHYPWNINQSL